MLQKIDRRAIYLLLIAALSIPILCGYQVAPARMKAAEKLFAEIEKLTVKPGQIAFIAMDFGPNVKAENEPQAEVVIEHLMRRRIPVALFSMYYQAEPFLVSVPERVSRRLMREIPGESWEYGRDWVNLGYRPGAGSLIQGIPKSDDLRELFGEDVRGNKLGNVPAFQGVRTLNDIRLLAEFTGLVGVFNTYIQFFQTRDFRPVFVHGCTSITIPEAFIYMDSGQLSGLLEGIAGAAWYSELLQRKFAERERDDSLVINTALGIAHLIIILLIVLGNISGFLGGDAEESRAKPDAGLGQEEAVRSE